MLHCYICDYSETVRSDVYQSLHGVDPVGNKVVYDELVDEYVCVDCLGASLANYRSLLGTVALPKEPGELEYELELDNDDLPPPWNFEELEDDIRHGDTPEDHG